jgi:hypothetical protein
MTWGESGNDIGRIGQRAVLLGSDISMYKKVFITGKQSTLFIAVKAGKDQINSQIGKDHRAETRNPHPRG